MLLAAEKARSLLDPTTKFSMVYLLLRPLSTDSSDLRIGFKWSLMEFVRAVISRGRTFGLLLVLTSKSIVLTVTLFLVRDSVIISTKRVRSCLI